MRYCFLNNYVYPYTDALIEAGAEEVGVAFFERWRDGQLHAKPAPSPAPVLGDSAEPATKQPEPEVDFNEVVQKQTAAALFARIEECQDKAELVEIAGQIGADIDKRYSLERYRSELLVALQGG